MAGILHAYHSGIDVPHVDDRLVLPAFDRALGRRPPSPSRERSCATLVPTMNFHWTYRAQPPRASVSVPTKNYLGPVEAPEPTRAARAHTTPERYRGIARAKRGCPESVGFLKGSRDLLRHPLDLRQERSVSYVEICHRHP